MENETSRKKLAEMTPQERREYNLRAKRKSRERLKQKAHIPNADQFVMPERWESELRQYASETEQSIRSELADLTNQDSHVITAASSVLRGLEKSYEQRVIKPTGVLIGGYFPDALGSEIVEYVHKYPNILGSPIFNALYELLLREIVRWARKNQEYVTAQFIAEVQAALDGKYTLPPEAEPPKAPEPPPAVPQQRLPSDAEILERGRRQLLDRLQPLLSPEARNYLNRN